MPDTLSGTQAFSSIGNYEVLMFKSTTGSETVNINLPNNANIAGAFMAYESEVSANVASLSDTASVPPMVQGQAMLIQAPNGNTISCAGATQLLTGDITQNPQDNNASVNQFADITDFLKAHGSGAYTNISTNVGSKWASSIVYVILEDSSFPFQDVILTSFCGNDATATGVVSNSLNVNLTPPYMTPAGQTGTITTFMGTFDAGDSLNINYGSTSLSLPSSLSGAFVTCSYLVSKPTRQLSFSLTLTNGSSPTTINGENISTFLLQIPISPTFVTYSLIDQNGSIIPYSAGASLSSNIWTDPDDSSVPEVLNSAGKLYLNGISGQAFPHFTAPALTGYSYVSELSDTPSFIFQGNAPSNVNYQYYELSDLVIPQGSWQINDSSYQVGKKITATFNQPVNNFNIPYRYSNWETTLTLPSDFVSPTIQVLDNTGKSVTAQIDNLGNNQYKATISPDTMAALAFNGETYSFVATGTLNAQLTDQTVLNFNADTVINDTSTNTPYQTNPISHKITVKVKYLRQGSTDSVAKSSIYVFGYGKAWSVPPLAVLPTGYYLDTQTTKDVMSGDKLNFTDKTLTYYYAPIEKNIFVNYYDESGTKIGDNSFKANYLESYTTSAQDIEDTYSLLTNRIPKNATGIVGNTDVTVNYYYRKTKGYWVDLGYHSSGITRLDYHGHIRSNALQYADGQMITLINTKNGILLYQDDKEGSVMEKEINSGKIETLKVGNNDSITVQVQAMGSAIITRKTPVYTMVTQISKGNFSNTTKIYNGKTLVEEDSYQANGVKGVLLNQQIKKFISGRYVVTSKKILTGSINTLNQSAQDAPATEYVMQMKGETQDVSNQFDQKNLISAAFTPTVPNTPRLMLIFRPLFYLTKAHADEETSDTTDTDEETETDTTDITTDDDVMAENNSTFTSSLTGSATIPENPEDSFKESTGDMDDTARMNQTANPSFEVSVTDNDKVLANQTLPDNATMQAEIPPETDGLLPATLEIQPTNDDIGITQPLSDDGVLPSMGEVNPVSTLLRVFGMLLVAISLLLLNRKTIHKAMKKVDKKKLTKFFNGFMVFVLLFTSLSISPMDVGARHRGHSWYYSLTRIFSYQAPAPRRQVYTPVYYPRPVRVYTPPAPRPVIRQIVWQAPRPVYHAPVYHSAPRPAPRPAPAPPVRRYTPPAPKPRPVVPPRVTAKAKTRKKAQPSLANTFFGAFKKVGKLAKKAVVGYANLYVNAGKTAFTALKAATGNKKAQAQLARTISSGIKTVRKIAAPAVHFGVKIGKSLAHGTVGFVKGFGASLWDTAKAFVHTAVSAGKLAILAGKAAIGDKKAQRQLKAKVNHAIKTAKSVGKALVFAVKHPIKAARNVVKTAKALYNVLNETIKKKGLGYVLGYAGGQILTSYLTGAVGGLAVAKGASLAITALKSVKNGEKLLSLADKANNVRKKVMLVEQREKAAKKLYSGAEKIVKLGKKVTPKVLKKTVPVLAKKAILAVPKRIIKDTKEFFVSIGGIKIPVHLEIRQTVYTNGTLGPMGYKIDSEDLNSLVSRFAANQGLKKTINKETSANLKLVKNLSKVTVPKEFGKNTLKHLMVGDVEKNSKGVLEAHGFHSIYLQDSNSKVLYPLSKRDKFGVYNAKVMVNGVKKGAMSTMFPDDWTPQTIANAISEAMKNKTPVPKRDGLYQGETSNHMRIEIKIVNGKIDTAYPVWQGGGK